MFSFFERIQLQELFCVFCPLHCIQLLCGKKKKETDSCYPFWRRVSGVLWSKMFTAAPCDSFLRVGKWQSRTEYALIALFPSPSQRSQLWGLKCHYSWMPAISRWSGWGDSVFGDMLQPESSICFIYCLPTYISVVTGTVVNVKNGLHKCYLNNYIRYFLFTRFLF